MQAWLDLNGNAYALKEFDARGKIIALWPVHPHWVTVLRVPGTWELFYEVKIPGEEAQTIPDAGMVHLRGLTLDGFVGVSPITITARRSDLRLARSVTALRSSATAPSPTAR
jgi:phage portal protein BeeE